MRRFLFALLLFPLLTACTPGGLSPEEALALDIRGRYLEMDRCAGQAEVTADYGRRVYTFGVEFAWTPEETRVTITEPETVAGITARLRAGESVLEYDGLSLDTGPLDRDGLAPVSAVPALLTAAAEGFITDCRTEAEESLLRVDCGDPEETPDSGREVRLWFDRESGDLRRGEIYAGGVRVVSCELTEFTKEFHKGEDP